MAVLVRPSSSSTAKSVLGVDGAWMAENPRRMPDSLG
jgi:hypothetical protein